MSKIIFAVPPIQLKEICGELSEETSILPPLGITILASVTRSLGFETKIMDFLAERKTLDVAAKQIIDENPKYVGITATTYMLYFAVQLAKAIKKIKKDIIVLIGGPHISSVPLETMERFDCFDFGFIGESEETMVNFLRAYENNGNIAEVRGLVLRNNRNEVVYTGVQPPISDMDKIPFPSWDLLPDIKKHYRPTITNHKRDFSMSLVTSRGCAGQCIFCDSSVFGKRIRGYSSGYIIKMMDCLITEYGVKEICFYDDTFVAFKKRLFEICDIILNKKINIIWSCNARVNLVDPETLKMMKRAGCWQISYGIESGSQRVLDILKKGINIRQIENAVKYTKEAGISPKGYFMIGNPGETKEDIEKTREIMLSLQLDDALVGYFTPYPGTEAYRELKKYGNFNHDWKELNSFSVTFVPYGLTEEYLRSEFKSLYAGFYIRPRIIFNYMRRFGSFKMLFSLCLRFIKFLLPKSLKGI